MRLLSISVLLTLALACSESTITVPYEFMPDDEQLSDTGDYNPPPPPPTWEEEEIEILAVVGNVTPAGALPNQGLELEMYDWWTGEYTITTLHTLLNHKVCAREIPIRVYSAYGEVRGDGDGDPGIINNNIQVNERIDACYGWTDDLMVSSSWGDEFYANPMPIKDDGTQLFDFEQAGYVNAWRTEADWGVEIQPHECRIIHLSCEFNDMPNAYGTPDVYMAQIERSGFTVVRLDTYDVVPPEQIEFQNPDGLNTDGKSWLILNQN